MRNQEIGFVFQSFNLLARTSALEHVTMPLTYAYGSISDREANKRGMELLDQCPHIAFDALLCPCGGGGLSAGIALTLAERQPDTQLHIVEPAGFDDTTRSLAAAYR